MNELRMKRIYLRDENKKQPDTLTPVPRCDWPRAMADPRFVSYIEGVWRSRRFLVQMMIEHSGAVRLSINRTEINSAGGWKDGISWEELMQIKAEAGFADKWAVECYPPNADVVNVANIRHLWLLPAPPSYGWH